MKTRGEYNLFYNAYIPEPKLLSHNQVPSRQLVRIQQEYERLLDLAHSKIINEKTDKKRFYETLNSDLPNKQKAIYLRKMVINFYEDWKEELETITEFLQDTSGKYWHPQGERYNILRPLPSNLSRRVYDPVEIGMVPYKNIYRIKNRSTRKIPCANQLTNFTRRTFGIILANIVNNKRGINLLKLQRNIASLNELINSQPEAWDLPTLPKYHGTLKTKIGYIYW